MCGLLKFKVTNYKKSDLGKVATLPKYRLISFEKWRLAQLLLLVLCRTQFCFLPSTSFQDFDFLLFDFQLFTVSNGSVNNNFVCRSLIVYWKWTPDSTNCPFLRWSSSKAAKLYLTIWIRPLAWMLSHQQTQLPSVTLCQVVLFSWTMTIQQKQTLIKKNPQHSRCWLPPALILQLVICHCLVMKTFHFWMIYQPLLPSTINHLICWPSV